MIKPGILGNRAEKLATKFLQKQGLKLIEQNYRCKLGEIDLVMAHQDYLIFVEVRHRKSTNYGGALESIDFRKQEKLRKTAEHYFLKRKTKDCPARFDVVCVDGQLTNPEYNWIQNAF